MPSFTVKNIPDEVFARLKSAAELHRRSINSEIITCLERSHGALVDPAEVVARARRLRASVRGPSLSQEEIRQAREAGRS